MSLFRQKSREVGQRESGGRREATGIPSACRVPESLSPNSYDHNYFALAFRKQNVYFFGLAT